MEEFPVEYIAALREVALGHVENDDLDYENIEMLAQNVYTERDQFVLSDGEFNAHFGGATDGNPIYRIPIQFRNYNINPVPNLFTLFLFF